MIIYSAVASVKRQIVEKNARRLAEIGVPTHLIAIELTSGLCDSINPASIRKYLPTEHKQFYPENRTSPNSRKKGERRSRRK
jgi:hypothetical protein